MALTHIRRSMNNPKINVVHRSSPTLVRGLVQGSTRFTDIVEKVVNGGRKVCHVASLRDE